MWSLKLTTEQRYKYFEPILPDIKADIKLFWDCYLNSGLFILAARSSKSRTFLNWLTWMEQFKSFIIERTSDNQYQITFYE